MAIVKRTLIERPLTWVELDGNFQHLDDIKLNKSLLEPGYKVLLKPDEESEPQGLSLPENTVLGRIEGSIVAIPFESLPLGVSEEYVDNAVETAINAVLDGVPGALDTLNELAAAINDDASFAASVTSALAAKAPLANPTFTGTPAGPTAAPGTNTTQFATTAFVAALGALKADINSPTFTGTPAGPTAAPGTDTTQLATTAFVLANAGSIPGEVLQSFGTLDTNFRQITDSAGHGSMFYLATNSAAFWCPVMIGDADTPLGRLHVKSLGSTSGTNNLISHNGSGTQLFKIDDAGNVYFGSSGQAYVDTNGQLFMDKWICKTSFGDDSLEWGEDELRIRITNNHRYSFKDAGAVFSNTGTVSLNGSAVFQVDSTTKGLLVPRMTTAQRDAISTPANGLMVYNTTTDAFNFYRGTDSAWKAISYT